MNITDLPSILSLFHIRILPSEYENMIQYIDSDNTGVLDRLQLLLVYSSKLSIFTLLVDQMAIALFLVQTTKHWEYFGVCSFFMFLWHSYSSQGSLSYCTYNKTKLYYESPLQVSWFSLYWSPRIKHLSFCILHPSTIWLISTLLLLIRYCSVV